MFWRGRHYNLTETYSESMDPVRLCLDIASPPEWTGNGVSYVDYELDVVKDWGGKPVVCDEDEFREAIIRYGYVSDLQAPCWAAVDEALDLADRWTWYRDRSQTKPERCYNLPWIPPSRQLRRIQQRTAVTVAASGR